MCELACVPAYKSPHQNSPFHLSAANSSFSCHCHRSWTKNGQRKTEQLWEDMETKHVTSFPIKRKQNYITEVAQHHP